MLFSILSLAAFAFSLPVPQVAGINIGPAKPLVPSNRLNTVPLRNLVVAKASNKDLFETPDLVLRPELASKPGATEYFEMAQNDLKMAQNQLIKHHKDIQSAMNEINKQHRKLTTLRNTNGEIDQEIKQMKNVEAAKVEAQAVVNELRSKRLDAVKAHNQLEQLGVPKSQLPMTETELTNARQDLERIFKKMGKSKFDPLPKGDVQLLEGLWKIKPHWL